MGLQNASCVVSEFRPPTYSVLYGITAGPDGAIWFTEDPFNAPTPMQIGRVRLAPPPPTVTKYTITTVACNGDPEAPLGDNGPATAAGLQPDGVAADRLGNLFVIDPGGFVRPSAVRRVDITGTITTLACDGSDPLGITPWGPTLPAHQALCGDLSGVEVDNSGNVYITQGGGRTLDRVTVGTVSIVRTDVNEPQNVALPETSMLPTRGTLPDRRNPSIRRIGRRRRRKLWLLRRRRSGDQCLTGVSPRRGGGCCLKRIHSRYQQCTSPKSRHIGNHHHCGWRHLYFLWHRRWRSRDQRQPLRPDQRGRRQCGQSVDRRVHCGPGSQSGYFRHDSDNRR
jgi:hypothetical protein